MRLLQFPYSPFAAKIRCCAKLAKVPLEVVDVPYTDRAELVRLTGAMYVPVLVDGDRVTTESSKIVALLDERAGGKLRANPLSVVIEQWADEWFQETAFKFCCPALEDRMGRDQGPEAKALFRLIKERRYGGGAIAQWRADEAKLKAATLELIAPIVEVLRRSPFVLGAEPTLADAAIASQLFMVEAGIPGFVERELPSLSAWYQQLMA